jgi:hypothetical protein
MYAVVAVHSLSFVILTQLTCDVRVIFTHLYIVWLASVLFNKTPCPFDVVVPVRATVVSTRLVVKLPAVIVAVAFGSNNVPLGLQASSVSNLIIRFVLGAPVLQRPNFKEVLATPDHIKGKDTLVFHITSHIFCLLLASAKVVGFSKKRLSH